MSKFVRNITLINKSVSFKDIYMNFNDKGIAEVPEKYLEELLELANYIQVNEDGSEYVAEANETNQTATDTSETTEEESDVDVPENETTDELKTTLEGMTIKQLARYAVKEKINLGAATKKDEIITVILESKAVAQ